MTESQINLLKNFIESLSHEEIKDIYNAYAEEDGRNEVWDNNEETLQALFQGNMTSFGNAISTYSCGWIDGNRFVYEDSYGRFKCSNNIYEFIEDILSCSPSSYIIEKYEDYWDLTENNSLDEVIGRKNKSKER